MSRHRSAANRARQERRDAERDKAHWRGRRDNARSPQERGVMQRGVSQAQHRIDRANDTIRKG